MDKEWITTLDSRTDWQKEFEKAGWWAVYRKLQGFADSMFKDLWGYYEH